MSSLSFDEAVENIQSKHPNKLMSWCNGKMSSLYNNSMFASIATFFLTALLLLCIRPPIVRKKNARRSISYVSILVWSLIVGVIVYIIQHQFM